MFTRHELRGKLLGIEIEYYPATREQIPVENTLTDCGRDGSLSDGGREVRRITWKGGGGRLVGLLSLRVGGKIDRRCGLHVHVDVRHLEPEQAGQTYDRICKLSKHLQKLCPKSRRRNCYCRWGNNRNGSPDRTAYDRYCAVNFASYEKYGTIEFRCQAGTVNLVKAETWALLCQFLVKYCSEDWQPLPKTWKQFLHILPEPMRTWAFLRREKLYGKLCGDLSERVLSACDVVS